MMCFNMEMTTKTMPGTPCHCRRGEAIYIPLDLSFFDQGDKTEKPTPRKKRKAREEGQVARSQEVGVALLLISGFTALRMFGGTMLRGILNIFTFGIGLIPEIGDNFETIYLSQLVAHFFLNIILIVLPVFVILAIVGLIVNLIQVGWHPTLKPLKPKFNKLNPLKGFKRMFSLQAVVNLVKSLLKLGIIGFVIYMLMRNRINLIPAMIYMSFGEAAALIGDIIVTMGLTIGFVYIIVAALDFVYTWFKHNKELKMSKHEVKEEWKQTEGNPLIKGKIKQKMREVSMRRMMQEVPKADVIITNPTHYAVALKYDHLMEGTAPIVVAKGVDFLAKRIREMGQANNIEIVENPALARALYNEVEVNQEIPPGLYEAVAEILAYVFKIRNRISEHDINLRHA